jgi:hypothetical protein
MRFADTALQHSCGHTDSIPAGSTANHLPDGQIYFLDPALFSGERKSLSPTHIFHFLLRIFCTRRMGPTL